MNDRVHTNSHAGEERGNAPFWQDTDPICLAISKFRVGFADYDANAPDDDRLAKAYAEVTFRPPRRAIVEWKSPAKTKEGAIAALMLARDADENDDHDMVGPLLKAALAFLELHA